MAMLVATVAFSIDAMLPALPEIGQTLSPDAPNQAQLILTSFILGMGLGTFFTGPLSDTFGRKPVMVGGAVVYIAGAGAAYFAQSLEIMLAAVWCRALVLLVRVSWRLRLSATFTAGATWRGSCPLSC